MALPSEMLDEILCRVPVKHLLRFRSVSKGWCSLIDTTPFIKKHLKNAGLIFNQDGKFYLAEDFRSDSDFDEVVAVEMFDPLKTCISGAHLLLLLICVSNNKMNDFYIFNPSTRKSRKVPSAPTEFPRSFHMIGTSLSGFGYDHLNDDYKVVAECHLQFRGKMAIVYSLKTSSWKQIRDVPDNNTRFFGHWGMFANGALHWIVVSDGGTVGILDMYPKGRTDVWVMRTDSAAENSWSKALTAEEKRGTLGYESFVRPVYYTRSGQSVVLEVDGSKLLWYDLEKKNG
ncbi:hypothetical protein AgCh_032206 [Apium graveolens]